MVDGLVTALVMLKVTLLVDFTRNALLVFKMELGVLVDMLDTDEVDEFMVAMVSNGARLWESRNERFRSVGSPKTGSWKRAPT